jgi:hypothetical protein
MTLAIVFDKTLWVNLVLVALVGIIFFFIYKNGKKGIWIDPNDPLFQKATEKARETVPVLLSLLETYPEEVPVKFAFTTDTKQVEHVWGTLIRLNPENFEATIDVQLRSQFGMTPEKVELPISALEDWLIRIEDEKFRGGFTIQAELQIAKRTGQKLQNHMQAMDGKFVDLLE